MVHSQHGHLYACRATRLTSLVLNSIATASRDNMFTVGDAEALTALHRLRHLQLSNCMTAPLTQGITQMTNLTTLGIWFANTVGHTYDPTQLLVRHMLATMGRRWGRLSVGSHREHQCSSAVWFSQAVELMPTALRLCLQALPTSLQILETETVSLAVLAQLTKLERMWLCRPKYHAGSMCSMSVLQHLTDLELDQAGDKELHAFAGCPALRTLTLHRVALLSMLIVCAVLECMPCSNV
jgi:hypothetical protein